MCTLRLSAEPKRCTTATLSGATVNTTGASARGIYVSGAVEYDDRAESPVRDELVKSVTIWRAALARAIAQAKEEGHLRAEADPQLMLFEMYSLELGLHHDARFLRLPNSAELAMVALNKLIQSYRT